MSYYCGDHLEFHVRRFQKYLVFSRSARHQLKTNGGAASHTDYCGVGCWIVMSASFRELEANTNTRCCWIAVEYSGSICTTPMSYGESFVERSNTILAALYNAHKSTVDLILPHFQRI